MSGILSRRRALLGLAGCSLTLGAAGRLRANDLSITGFGQVICQAKGLPQFDYAPVSYTHLTLPTIYSV